MKSCFHSKLKNLKNKVSNLIKKVKTSDDKFREMEMESEIYKRMMNAFSYQVDRNDKECRDKDGNVIWKYIESENRRLDIDIPKLIKGMGISVDRDKVKINVKM